MTGDQNHGGGLELVNRMFGGEKGQAKAFSCWGGCFHTGNTSNNRFCLN